MQLRRVTGFDDFQKILELILQAWDDSPVVSWIAPGREEYPLDYLEVWRYLLAQDLLDPRTVAYVAMSEQEDEGPAQLMGFSVWKRYGESEEAKSWGNNPLAENAELLSLQAELGDVFKEDSKNRAISLERVKELLSKEETAVQIFPPENWRLRTLGVSPQFQRQGLGKKLTRWGIDQAQKENVALTLEASAKGRGLYESLGFVTKDWIVLDDGKVKQAVMIKEP